MIPAVVGSNPIVHPTFGTAEVDVERLLVGRMMNLKRGPLAQLVEQLTLNQLVVGSIPTRPTNSMT